MAKRQTVAVNLPVLLPLIKSKFRSNVVFCEAMGRAKQKTWVTEWGRNHNLPSPEEVAQMCLLLNTTPEEILTEPADIELVNGLIESERAKHAKKLPATTGGEMTGTQRDAWELIQSWDDEKLKKFIAAAKAMLGE